jgi:hypothetical protein
MRSQEEVKPGIEKAKKCEERCLRRTIIMTVSRYQLGYRFCSICNFLQHCPDSSIAYRCQYFNRLLRFKPLGKDLRKKLSLERLKTKRDLEEAEKRLGTGKEHAEFLRNYSIQAWEDFNRATLGALDKKEIINLSMVKNLHYLQWLECAKKVRTMMKSISFFSDSQILKAKCTLI